MAAPYYMDLFEALLLELISKENDNKHALKFAFIFLGCNFFGFA